ncbi:MAG: ATP synthase F1 subunit epsilon [Mariprofundaceae bacterium]|nr:ATP synthase F1 subunit epsilon [Mariprofundaceae bacterium]
MNLSVLVATAEQEVFRGEAFKVVAPGKAGEIAILPGHAPLLAALRPGRLRIHCPHVIDEVCVDVVVHGGFLEAQPDTVIILADVIERAADIDQSQAEKAVKQAKEHLVSARGKDIDRAMLILELALARLKVVSQGRRLQSHGERR